MKIKKPVSVFLSFLIIICAGCYPNGPEYLEDYDLVITKHDTSFDFQTLQTYSLPDSIIKITGNLENGEDVEIVNPIYASVILDNIRTSMNDYGWIEVDKHDSPNVILLPSAVQTTTDIWYSDSGYWDWYYPYSGGWYYPYPIYSGSYTTGSLIILMTYPEGRTAIDNITVLWTALVNGLLEGNTTDINERVVTSINTAFNNSPYLDLKPR